MATGPLKRPASLSHDALAPVCSLTSCCVRPAGQDDRLNDGNGLAIFTSNDGDHVSFHGEDIFWTDGSTRGSGDPCCLQTLLEDAAVDLRVMWVAVPDNVSYELAVWLKYRQR